MVSSDEAMKEVLDKQQKSKDENLYQKCQKEAGQLFFQRLEATVNKFKKLEHNSVIVLDRNHTPDRLGHVIDFLDALENKHYRLELVGLVPKTFQKVRHYPFSIPFMFQSLCRLLNRGNHLTLSNTKKSDEEIIEIFFQFVNQFQGVSALDQGFVDKY